MRAYLITALLLFSLAGGMAAPGTTQVVIGNSAPAIESVTTYVSYINRTNNTPSTAFSAYDNTTNVFIQVVVSDPNGYADLQSAKILIVKWNTTHETLFSHFGSSYINAAFEYGNGTGAIYAFSFNMSETDESRLGIESPLKFYRVKAQANDSSSSVTSDLSAGENADYTFNGTTPSFDINITSLNGALHPGDAAFWNVNITKYAPPWPKDVNITYEFINPLGLIIGSLNESVSITDTLNRLINFTIPAAGPDGTYTLRVTMTYPEGSTQANSSVSVTYPEEEAGAGGGGAGIHRGYLNTTGHPVERMVIFTNLPESIDVYPDETVVLVTVVQNVGNSSVPSLSLEVDGIIPASAVTPINMTVLKRDAKGVFILSIDLPRNLAEGRYRYGLSLRTDDLKITKDFFYLDVRNPPPPLGLTEYEILGNEIQKTGKALKEIEAEVQKKQDESFDVTGALSLLASADSHLADAVRNLNAHRFDDVRTDLARAKGLINEAVAKEYGISASSEAFDFTVIIFFLSLSVAVLLIRAIWYSKRGH